MFTEGKVPTHLLLHLDVELPDTLQRQFFLLDQDTNRLSHEPFGHIQYIHWHCRRQKNHLCGVCEDVGVWDMWRVWGA